ncbi:FecR domain-containing protein [Pseudomaricurvus alkylphenolicus]|uniref:FecR family protein n=1 Tax=Pseudomaricurvus alkylphenolicus TaxID=1306991 RepID=UPI001420915A|nr:FecR family protein [Pseudomaricurvus alkylphenolicus]NIB42927.1 FecR domain-containing protein [Pseudomaricurvus alkylphenolicus]
MIAKTKCIIGLVCLLVIAPVLAQTSVVGNVTHLDGVLSALRTDGRSKLLGVKSEVIEGDVLETAARSFARIKFIDDGEVVLRPNSRFQVSEYKFKNGEGSSLMRLLKGGLRAVTGYIGETKKENYKVETPVAVIGIRGTNYGALFCSGDCGDLSNASGQQLANGLYVDVAQGAVILSNGAGQILVTAGQFGYVRDINTPPVLLPPEQGVQVTMPTRISKNNMNGNGLGDANDEQCTIPTS